VSWQGAVLQEAGIKDSECSRWECLERLDDAVFDAYIAETQAAGRGGTSSTDEAH
jgi:hypothetical protein